MPDCCDTLDPTPAPPSIGQTLTIALAGNPNSGKTTVFNALTGLRQKVANYPGVTVEKKTGRCKLPGGGRADVIDLPGTYSLISRSPDETVAMEVLRGLRQDTRPPDVVILVVDASNLQRNLYLLSQLIELGRPLVVALNMTDIAQRRGLHISADNLARDLGVPVIPIVGSKRRGIDELKAAVSGAAIAPLPDFDLPAEMKAELKTVAAELAAITDGATLFEPSGISENRRAATSVATVSAGVKAAALFAMPPGKPRDDHFRALAERLLIGDRAADIAPLALQPPIAGLLESATARLIALGIDPMQADVEAHYKWIEAIARRAADEEADGQPRSAASQPQNGSPTTVLSYENPRRTLTNQIDAILIHKFWGLLIFAIIMAGLFITIFSLAQPIMDAINGGIQALGAFTTHTMSDGPLKDLINNGIFNGVGTVVTFVPQIALLFLFLAVLEDSGYLARAAFLMDRLLSKVGLNGKSFIPLLSSFACAIPGIMATRTIENRRERLATILVAPFMSCSARLPVYALLIGAFFSGEAMGFSSGKAVFVKAGIMLACYALGIVAAAGTAWVFKRTLTRGPATSFILELPSYKMPQVSQVARAVWVNTRAFLTKAGTTIFCLSVVLWAMAYYPRLPADRATAIAQSIVQPHGDGADANIEQIADHAVAAAQSEYSISGRLGHFIEPAIRPLGFDWKMGIGLISAFAAREEFVGSMGIVYSVGEVEKGQYSDLSTAMRGDHYASGPLAGKPVWTPLVAVTLLIWFVLAMQCMSTVAVVRRETGGWRWPVFMIVYMNALAYIVCLIVFQIGSRVMS